MKNFGVPIDQRFRFSSCEAIAGIREAAYACEAHSRAASLARALSNVCMRLPNPRFYLLLAAA